MKPLVTYLLVLLSITAAAQDTVPLPYYEDWNSYAATTGSHPFGWWFCKSHEDDPSIILRSNPHGMLFSRMDDSIGATMATPVFEVLPDSASFYLYGSHLGDSTLNVEFGYLPDGSAIVDGADVCALFVPYDTVVLITEHEWVRTTVDLWPYYSCCGVAHRFAFRLRNGLYQRMYIDEIRFWRGTVHDTIVCMASVCQSEAYSGCGFNIDGTETNSVGTIEHWRCDTIGDSAHHYHLLLTVTPPRDTSIERRIILGDSLLYNGDTLTEAGTYRYILTTASGCDSLVTLFVSYEEVNLSASADGICPGDTVSLVAHGTHTAWWSASPPDPYLDAQQGLTVVVVNPRQPTTYSLCSREGGEVLAAIEIDVKPMPELCIELSRPFLDKDFPVIHITDCSEGSAMSTWTFSDGIVIEGHSAHRQFHYPLPDSVEVTLQSCNRYQCCADTTFSIPSKIRSIWFSNVFTPGEETNNRFGCTASFEITAFELHIYNRQGLLVYSTTDPTATWDGTRNGIPLPQGTYVYYWHARDAIDFNRTGSGTITLIR